MSTEINSMSPREAMRLTPHFQPSQVEDLGAVYERIRKLSTDEILRLIADKTVPLEQRYVAGQLLALIGDPRINPLSPEMLNIPENEILIGIAAEQVKTVIQDYADEEVKPEWIEKEVPQFKLRIPAFRIAKYLVTQYEYKIFLKDTQYTELPNAWEFGIYPPAKANHPVYSLKDSAAIAYTEWLSQKTGRHFRLPTEFEWEYAASGLAHSQFPWGDEDQLDMANTLEAGFYASTPVGIFLEGASSFGVLDMAGNVEEYVQDFYAPYPRGQWVKDDLSTVGRYRITRGGSFSRHRDLARTTRRHGYYDHPIYVFGFRLAETI